MSIDKAKMQDTLIRAAKTFAQAALAVVVASGTGYLEVDVWKGAAVAGGAALFAFVWNLLGGTSEQ